jgi:hypothetical protein
MVCEEGINVVVRHCLMKQIVKNGGRKKVVHCMDIYRWMDYQLKSYMVPGNTQKLNACGRVGKAS